MCIVLCATLLGCASLAPRSDSESWSYVTVVESAEPIVANTLAEITVDSAKSPSMLSHLAFDAPHEARNLEAALEHALRNSNLFGTDTADPLRLHATFRSYQNPMAGFSFWAAASVHYELISESGEVLFDDEIVSRAQSDSVNFVGQVRLNRARTLALVKNVEDFRLALEPALYAYRQGEGSPELEPPQTVAGPVETPDRPASPLRAPATAPVGEEMETGAYHALVVGNSSYASFPRLSTPTADAQALASLLAHDYAFDVTVLLDGSGQQLEDALAKFQSLGPQDNLLIYYAGHTSCDTRERDGYWLPVDARQDTPASWLSTTELSQSLRTMQARHVLVIVDGCYARRLLRGGVPGARDAAHFSTLASKRARVVLTSGVSKPEVGTDGLSWLASALVGALRSNEGVLEGEAVYEIVRPEVRRKSEQSIEYADIFKAGHRGGDFLFVRSRR